MELAVADVQRLFFQVVIREREAHQFTTPQSARVE